MNHHPLTLVFAAAIALIIMLTSTKIRGLISALTTARSDRDAARSQVTLITAERDALKTQVGDLGDPQLDADVDAALAAESQPTADPQPGS